jgi:hypothetical protein
MSEVDRPPIRERSSDDLAEASDRLFQSGILDEIYEHAYQHGRTGRVLPVNERDAQEDAFTIAAIVLGRTEDA